MKGDLLIVYCKVISANWKEQERRDYFIIRNILLGNFDIIFHFKLGAFNSILFEIAF